jgi:hypothetical protein
MTCDVILVWIQAELLFATIFADVGITYDEFLRAEEILEWLNRL